MIGRIKPNWGGNAIEVNFMNATGREIIKQKVKSKIWDHLCSWGRENVKKS